MSARYRADQVGSLLRPKALLDARAAHENGELSDEQLRTAEDQAILAAIDMQRAAGVDVYVDGEFRRKSYMMGLYDAIDGFGLTPQLQVAGGAGGGFGGWRGTPIPNYPRVQYPACVGKLAPKRRLAQHEAAFLKAHAPGPYKATLPGAQMIGSTAWRPGLSDTAYPTRGEFMNALAGILRSEVQALISEGVPYIQIDAPAYTQFADSTWRERMLASGVDLGKALDEYIAADNAIISGLATEGVTLGFHLCRGNSGGQWLSEGGYDPIAERLFTELRYDTFLLEYDTDRAGGFEPLRFMPKGKTVVLGLITTKSGALESQTDLLKRIDDAARYVPIENLALSPQCGFASSIPGNPLTDDEQRRKLELVASTARQAWG
ncbi:MAG TPA: cobalamin-independent methionine synthase II family protein [Chloroflexota bacterium]|nr:cobalamin-independent methionine synthase II family protein [Chloroflexota bacterium]